MLVFGCDFGWLARHREEGVLLAPEQWGGVKRGGCDKKKELGFPVGPLGPVSGGKSKGGKEVLVERGGHHTYQTTWGENRSTLTLGKNELQGNVPRRPTKT